MIGWLFVLGNRSGAFDPIWNTEHRGIDILQYRWEVQNDHKSNQNGSWGSYLSTWANLQKNVIRRQRIKIVLGLIWGKNDDFLTGIQSPSKKYKTYTKIVGFWPSYFLKIISSKFSCSKSSFALFHIFPLFFSTIGAFGHFRLFSQCELGGNPPHASMNSVATHTRTHTHSDANHTLGLHCFEITISRNLKKCDEKPARLKKPSTLFVLCGLTDMTEMTDSSWISPQIFILSLTKMTQKSCKILGFVLRGGATNAAKSDHTCPIYSSRIPNAMDYTPSNRHRASKQEPKQNKRLRAHRGASGRL